MEAEVSKRFECPVCLALPQKEIFQCTNGHTICHTCVDQVSNCPQCRVPYDNPPRRCRALEQVLDLAKHDCPNKNLGCAAKLSRNEVSSHSDICLYGGDTMKLCKILDQNCDYVLSFRNLEEAVEHLKSKHGFGVCHSNEVNLHLENFQALNLKEDTSWAPTIANLIDSQNKFYIIICKFHKIDLSLSFTCLEVLHNSLQENLIPKEIRFSLSNPTLPQESAITLTEKCTQRPSFQKRVKDPICRVFARHALSLRNKENQLVVKCCIQDSVSLSNQATANIYAASTTKVKTVPYTQPMQQQPVIISRILEPRDPNLRFGTWVCRPCEHEIRGILYYCVSCVKPLCMYCYEGNEHNTQHLCFVVQTTPAVEKLPVVFQRIPKREVHDLRTIRQGLELANEQRHKCGSCGAIPIVMCLECRSPKSYCKTCFKTLATTADSCLNHRFAVIRTRKQELDVIAVLKFLPRVYEPIKFLRFHSNYSD